MKWVHVILGTRCSWLHGDRRGFRSRGHRIHSSGDYRKPPPEGEHAELREYHQQRSGDVVVFDQRVRIEILRGFVGKMHRLECRIIVASVGGKHLHALCELPGEYGEWQQMVGKCKQHASHQVRGMLPGSVWAEGGKFEPIRDLGHLRNAYGYIREKQEGGTVVWSHRGEEDWILCPGVGVVVMGVGGKRIRVFAGAQTPASERGEDPDS
ncbi:MAG TPA: hypothetical protein VFE58_03205 [Tepidisphaeraceae bacterium]|nr:hypothetical protein [Tepidisphaeraceae bacterium]